MRFIKGAGKAGVEGVATLSTGTSAGQWQRGNGAMPVRKGRCRTLGVFPRRDDRHRAAGRAAAGHSTAATPP
jgi:hypothetical protein